MVLSCIVVQALVAFGFQIKDFSDVDEGVQDDTHQRFFQWVTLTNVYALVALLVARALPCLRRGLFRLIALAIGILLASSGGVLQVLSTTDVQVRFASNLDCQHRALPTR